MSIDFIQLTTGHIRELQAYQPGKPLSELEREYGVRDAAKLASNENPLGPSPQVQAALQQAVQGRNLAYYPDGNGFALKNAIAAHLQVSPAQLTLGSGSSEVLELTARVFADQRHSVVYSQYSFIAYHLVAQAIGVKSIVVPARAWGNDLPAMLAALKEHTRVIFIANPNNPTGTRVGKDELKTFLDAVPEHIVVVLDEAYCEYIEQEDYPNSLEWLPEHPNLVVTRTFSKAYGLAGLRIGYAVSSPQIADLLNRVRPPFNVNSMALLAAETALQDQAHVRATVTLNRAGLHTLEQGFTRLGLEYIPSLANFVSVDVGGDAMPVYEALLREGVIVRPVGSYGMPRHLRVSTGTEQENARCLEAFAKVLYRFSEKDLKIY